MSSHPILPSVPPFRNPQLVFAGPLLLSAFPFALPSLLVVVRPLTLAPNHFAFVRIDFVFLPSTLLTVFVRIVAVRFVVPTDLVCAPKVRRRLASSLLLYSGVSSAIAHSSCSLPIAVPCCGSCVPSGSAFAASSSFALFLLLCLPARFLWSSHLCLRPFRKHRCLILPCSFVGYLQGTWPSSSNEMLSFPPSLFPRHLFSSPV